MHLTIKVLLTCAALFGSAAFADGSTENGKKLYVTCAACHGADAQGNAALQAPRLNHLAPVYVMEQLQKFKSGVRGGSGSTAAATQMAPMAAMLADDQAMLDVANYIATLEGGPAAPSVQGDPRMGADYFNQFCGACHGGNAAGNLALHSPRLAGSDDWYLLAQINAFRDGSRGAHPDDRTGRQMRAMAGVLPDEQAIRDVVAFIASLPEAGE
tara:strand:- start:61044 stop:61682 length:639 start_codon:yes stop_codon:yes gene_type:complete